mmetsp:Transcript_19481/g.46520  ORF Transcript_19481/g.46520 Transcript_19481/m.46520 type:complete len:226 (-) Transcript_19481:1209-1886(-)
MWPFSSASVGNGDALCPCEFPSSLSHSLDFGKVDERWAKAILNHHTAESLQIHDVCVFSFFGMGLVEELHDDAIGEFGYDETSHVCELPEIENVVPVGVKHTVQMPQIQVPRSLTTTPLPSDQRQPVKDGNFAIFHFSARGKQKRDGLQYRFGLGCGILALARFGGGLQRGDERDRCWGFQRLSRRLGGGERSLNRKQQKAGSILRPVRASGKAAYEAEDANHAL